MSNKVSQIVLAGGVVLLALYDAGPKVVGEPCLKRLIGSEAEEVGLELPDCNTTGIVEGKCEAEDKNRPSSCQLTYRQCAQPNPGILQTRLCDPGNGGVACQVGGCVPRQQDRISSMKCRPVIPNPK